MGDAALLEIGKIVGVHGIRGTLKAVLYGDGDDVLQPERLIRLKTTSGGYKTYTVAEAQPYKKIFRLHLQEVTGRNQAEALVGATVFIDRKMLPAPEADTYYWADLLATAVFTVNGRLLGKLEEIIPTGGNDIFVVRDRRQTPVKEVLIPAVAAMIKNIDIENKRMEVDLPEGLE